jgi:hypothetical protein
MNFEICNNVLMKIDFPFIKCLATKNNNKDSKKTRLESHPFWGEGVKQATDTYNIYYFSYITFGTPKQR